MSVYSVLGQFINTLNKESPVSRETIKKEEAQIENFSNSLFQTINISSLNNKTAVESSLIGSTLLDVSNPFGSPIRGNSELKGNILLTGDIGSKVAGKPFGLLPDSNNYLLGAFICKKCGKSYSSSLTDVNINNLCSDCKKLNNHFEPQLIK